jgi:hypothetical protein
MRCQHCGSPIPLSSAPAEDTGYCPNHPDTPTVGACRECGTRLCQSCIYVYRSDKPKFFCETCSETVKDKIRVSNILKGVLLVVMFLVLLCLSWTWWGGSPFVAEDAFLLLFGIWMIFGRVRFTLLAEISIEGVNDHLPRPGSVPVVCPYCGTGYHYRRNLVASDLTVYCQNCSAIINIQGMPQQM